MKEYKVSDLRLIESSRAFYSLNFHSIWQIFKQNEWKYDFNGGKIPSVHELKNVVLHLLIDLEDLVLKRGLPKNEEDEYTSSTGRFEVRIDDCGIIQILLDITE